jgi:tetratricopeptide (TPR) repeat protein
MRKVFEAITERLGAFIAQRDHAALVVRCGDADCITVLKLLEELDDTSSSELFWMYPTDFQDARSYADAVVKDFLTKHDGMRLLMKHKKMRVWPPAPERVSDPAIAPAQRLRELMTFSRLLLPEPEGCSVVWIMFPLHVTQGAAYAQLMGELLQHRYPFPWFHHIRMILRDDVTRPELSEALVRAPGVDHYAPDLSDEAMDQALEEEAADESVPLADRVQTMFLSAQRDFSFGRFDEAMKKHEIFLRFHTAMGNGPMVALALNSVGEIHQRLGRTEQSARCFEEALEPACAGENPPIPILFNVLLNLANLRMGQHRFAEAEVYYDAGEKLATVQRNPTAKLQSMENLGVCQYMQGKAADAAKTWEHGAMIAGKLELPEVQTSLLHRLRAYYASMNQAAQVGQIDMQVAAIEAAQKN